MMPSIRESLSAALDETEQGDEQPAAPEAVDTPTAPAESAEPASESEPAEAVEPESKVPEPNAAPATPATPAAESLKAPASWRPAVREQWAKIPTEAQAEITKRERETAAALQESAGARQTAERLHQVIGPYSQFLQAEGAEPLQAINTLLSTAQVLRQGTPEVKGRAVAAWIRQFGVPLEAINAALGFAQQAPGGAAAPPTAVPPADPEQLVQQVMDRIGQQRQQFEQQRQAGVIKDFASSHEFFEDLRDDMADLIEGASRRGLALSVEEAYTRASKMHPEVSKIMDQRRAADSAAAARTAAQRTRTASSSVRSQATSVGRPSGQEKLRDTIERAWNDAEGDT